MTTISAPQSQRQSHAVLASIFSAGWRTVSFPNLCPVKSSLLFDFISLATTFAPFLDIKKLPFVPRSALLTLSQIHHITPRLKIASPFRKIWQENRGRGLAYFAAFHILCLQAPDVNAKGAFPAWLNFYIDRLSPFITAKHKFCKLLRAGFHFPPAGYALWRWTGAPFGACGWSRCKGRSTSSGSSPRTAAAKSTALFS